MKKALNAWSVPANVPFEALFPALKQAGFDAVELNLDAAGPARTRSRPRRRRRSCARSAR